MAGDGYRGLGIGGSWVRHLFLPTVGRS